METLKNGRPRTYKYPKKNAGLSLSPEVLEALKNLPQVKQEWTKSYLVEQILRNFLSLPADYDWSDLKRVSVGRVIE